MHTPPDIYTLDTLYKAVSEGKLILPTVQRGFVWKPYQIENLWDSILRGYPVGSVVLTPKNNENDNYEILDGQQRLTAIGLGMCKNEETILRSSQKEIRIFIDLAKPVNGDNRKYIFRVSTRSHPWGYQKKDSRKPIESKDRKVLADEIELKKEEKFFSVAIDRFYPFDARYPVPFEIFMNSENPESVQKEINAWRKKYWKGGKRVKDNESTGQLYSVEEIFNAVQNMKNTCKIPILYLSLPDPQKKFGEKENKQPDPKSTEDLTDTYDEIENLFIRLNAGGTPLTGEELNYSILKAHLEEQTIKEIETACERLFRPARFITLAYSLYKKQKTIRVKPTDFQMLMKKESQKFGEFITQTLNKKPNLLDQIANILIYDKETNPDGLPFILANRLSQHAPEVMFILMYRLHHKKDDIKIKSRRHRRTLGIITLFNCLGKGEQRNHSKLLRNIYPALSKLESEQFWSNETLQRALLPDDNGKAVLTIFPRLEELEKEVNILARKNNSNKRNGVRSKVDDKLRPFFDKMFWNKDLLLYAQRGYLASEFGDENMFKLDDTNVPFDWDHIFPHDYIKRKRGIPQSLKDWYHSNGNFWACPYEFNRSVQDDAPSQKFSCEDSNNKLKNAFMKDEYKKFFTGIESKDSLLYSDNWKKAYKFIMLRNFEILKEWYSKLNIDDLYPDNYMFNQEEEVEPIGDCLNSRKFKKITEKEIEENIVYDAVYKQMLPIDENLFLWIACYDENILIEHGIEFGLYGPSGLLEKNTANKKQLEYLIGGKDNFFWLYKQFTLISNSQESMKILFAEIIEFLEKLQKPIKLNNLNLQECFKKAIKKDFQP